MGGVPGSWSSSWYECRRCAALFRADHDAQPFAPAPAQTGGVCPQGGPHDGQQGVRLAVLASAASPSVTQAGWARCGKCSALFFAPTGTGGRCPADGLLHQADAGDALVANFDHGDPGTQPGWNLCRNCAVMFRADAGDLCPATQGAHQPPNPWVYKPPAHPPRFEVMVDSAPFLPHGTACVSGATVDFKVDTGTVIGWWTLCSGTWADDPQSPWQLHFIGEPSDIISAARFALSVTPDGLLHIDELVLNVTPSALSMLQQQAPSVATLLPILASGAMGGGTPVPCTNFFAGTFSDCEYNDGQNNNGVGAFLGAPQLDLQLWPKREDRIRLDVLPSGGRAVHFELDTHE